MLSSARIVVAAFWLVVIILTTTFAGQMKAMLMIRNEANRIDSMRDLSLRPHTKPIVPADSAVVASIRGSKDPSYQKVWRMIQKHKSTRTPAIMTSAASLRKVVRGEAVLISSPASLAGAAKCACANYTSGEFYIGRKPTFTFNSVFYLNKRMPQPMQRAINNR
ncbi:unnamed protein product [Ixodes persulcatus]